MGAIFQKYSVKHGDRIQEVAARVLGDTTRWIDIVSLNNLRRPYISDDLIDQFGPVLGILPLQTGLTKGDTHIYNWDSTVSSVVVGSRAFTSSPLLVPGAILIFTHMDFTPGTLGDRIYDVVQITKVQQGMLYSNGHISFNIEFTGVESYKSLKKRLVTHGGGILHDYSAGDFFQVFGSPLQLTTAVASTGDSLNMALLHINSEFDVTSVKDIVDSLGVDVALNPQTGQKSVGLNGDFATVEGVKNVDQALRIRCKTEPGELILHGTYGNNLKHYLGYTQDSGWPNLAITLLYECILQDPRVKDVINMQFRQVGDASFIDSTIELSQSGQIFTTTLKVQ